MDYYENARHDYIQKQMYPTEHRMDYFPKGAVTGTNVKIVPKPECIPKFVSKIEGNAVEEGDRVFFEGIIDAQPHPGKKETLDWPGWAKENIKKSVFLLSIQFSEFSFSRQIITCIKYLFIIFTFIWS